MEIPVDSSTRVKAIFNGIFLLFLSLLGFIAIGPFIGLALALLFIETPLIEIEGLLSNLGGSSDGKTLLYFMQAGATFGMFLLPYTYTKLKNKIALSHYSSNKVSPLVIALAGFITVSLMGVNAIVIDWNASLLFPEFMSDFENWARDMEDKGLQMTEWMTSFTDIPTLILSLLIMAVLPGIAEEFVFRGILQKELAIGFNNIHMAIWISAILFSAIHLQFYGFVPRVLLGALFGYLFYWSGNIIIPVFAHFVNNGFTLIMVYLKNNGSVSFDIQNSEAPSLASVLIFSIITFGLVYLFRNQLQKRSHG